MENRFSHVALIGKYRNPADTAQQVEQSLAALRQVAVFLQQRGCRVSLEQDTAACVGAAQLPVLPLEEIGRRCDLALVVGGDGTFLHVACRLAPFKVPLIGINQGRLGFITDIALEGFEQVLSPMLCGHCQWEERRLLQATAWRGGARLADGLALNDVVLYRGSTSGMVEVRVEVDGQFVASQRADGLIVSTATGSTAYALSVGGPMMHPDVNALLLVPIAPHTLSNRPIILPGDCEVTLRVAGVRGEASASFDMTSFAPLLPGDCVTVRSAEHAVRLLHPEGWSYFDTLRNKLHWNTGEQP